MVRDRGKDSHVGLGKRKWNDEGTSRDVDANLDRSCFPTLLPKHKIFLSHSGKQKWFVEKLCEDLEARHRFPFFDKRPSSLPKGERFPKLILEAAEQCELAVVVVSEEYLTSKWAMIELNTFVQALSGSNRGLKILPLFFGLSVSDLQNPSRQGDWWEVWNEWARDDGRIKPVEFEEALKVMRSFNGIKFSGDMESVWSYEKDVVRSVCSAVVADVKWDDSHVQGRSTICEAIRENMKVIEPSKKYGVCVFGYYGMGGIGKTTMCKTLCNELSEFSGKVCHIELGGIRSEEELLKEVLRKLTSSSEEVLQRLDEGECRNILKNRSSWRQETFLAIDNVWDDPKSMGQAKMLLKDPTFCEGSVVMVTSRCRSTLMHLGIYESHCFEVPELGKVDARKLFLYHIGRGEGFDNEEDNEVIARCLAHCRFRKSETPGFHFLPLALEGETQGFHYLPLALKVLGVHLGYLGDSPSAWLEGLAKVRNFNLFGEENSVFEIIRLNYDRLSVQLQALFMDVTLFKKSFWSEYLEFDCLNWLSLVHGQKLEDTQSQLLQLRERGLVEDVDMDSGRVSMHDLYAEFAKMEAEGKLSRSVGFESRRWVYSWGFYPSDLERTPSGRCWENLIRVRIEQRVTDSNEIFHLHGIQLRYCSNLVVLILHVRVKATGVLNLKGLRCLRSLDLRGRFGNVEGVEDLNNLRYFRWCGFDFVGGRSDEFRGRSYLGQLPASLEILQLEIVDACLRSDVFDRCSNLRTLLLSNMRASDSMDFSKCSSLQRVFLFGIEGLQKLLGLTAGLQSCLRSLRMRNCKDLSDVSGLGDLVRLDTLEVSLIPSLVELPDLQKLTSLQFLIIECSYGIGSIAEVRGLGDLRQLRELRCERLDVTELPNLSALEHLHKLHLSWCMELTTLEGLAGLTALRSVGLFGCGSLSRLPDLSNSSKLESLNVEYSGIELHEEDIDMLAALPGLESVVIGTQIHLYPVRRKIMRWTTGELITTVVSERNLESLPIKVQSYSGYSGYITLPLRTNV